MDYPAVTKTLKSILKRKKLRYHQLAEQLNISESGLKKILNAKDANFSKLSEICNCIDISLVDLLQEVESKSYVEAKFTKEQEKFFFHNKNFFYFYWLLVVERRTLKEIEQVYGLSKKQMSTYLTKLDSMNLIELHPNDKIKLPPLRPSRWVGEGPLTDSIQFNWGEELWQDAFEENQFHNIRYLSLDALAANELKNRLEEIEIEFVARSAHNQKLALDQKKAKRFRYMCALVDGSFVKSL